MICDPLLDKLGAFAIGGLFAAAALHKFAHHGSFRAALRGYRLLPESWQAAAGWLIPALELSIAALFLAEIIGTAGREAFLASAILLLVYAAAIGINLRRGNDRIDCGCLGFGKRSYLHRGMVLRNLALAGLALSLWGSTPGNRPLLWLDGLVLTFGLGIATLLYLSIDLLFALTRSESQA